MADPTPTCPWALVRVEWMDAFDAPSGWVDVDDYQKEVKPTIVVTVGYLWPDCLDGHITVTASYIPEELPNLETVDSPAHIPVGMVRSIVVLDQRPLSTRLTQQVVI